MLYSLRGIAIPRTLKALEKSLVLPLSTWVTKNKKESKSGRVSLRGQPEDACLKERGGTKPFQLLHLGAAGRG